jgi:hypothetical protein
MDMVWESDDESEVEDSVSEEEDSLERLEGKIKEEGVGLVVQLILQLFPFLLLLACLHHNTTQHNTTQHNTTNTYIICTV